MKQILTASILFLATISWSQAATAAVKTFPLWPDGPPKENGLSGDERPGGCVGNISVATLSVHLPPPEHATGAAIVITPGGGYGVVCTNTEGSQIAEALTNRGIAGIVVKYRLPNQHHEIPATDARRAIRTVRMNAADWNIDPNRIGVWGFSAGGHLASTVSTSFDLGDATADDPIDRQSSRPDFSILFYPVISMKSGVTHAGSRKNLLSPNASEDLVQQYSNELQVSADTPPTFLLHAADDKVVSIENAILYYQALLKHSIPARLVTFETGGHGPIAFHSNPSWAVVFEEWMTKR